MKIKQALPLASMMSAMNPLSKIKNMVRVSFGCTVRVRVMHESKREENDQVLWVTNPKA